MTSLFVNLRLLAGSFLSARANIARASSFGSSGIPRLRDLVSGFFRFFILEAIRVVYFNTKMDSRFLTRLLNKASN